MLNSENIKLNNDCIRNTLEIDWKEVNMTFNENSENIKLNNDCIRNTLQIDWKEVNMTFNDKINP